MKSDQSLQKTLKVSNILEEINKLFGSSTKTVITEEMLLEFPMDKWEEIDKGIDGKLVFVDKDVIVFLTKIKKGFTFGKHVHDIPEWCFVLKGYLGDMVTKEKKVKGQVIRYLEHVPHKPFGIKDTLLCVVFDRKK